jgi:hypothetical protein
MFNGTIIFFSNFSKEAFKVEIKDYFCHDFGSARGG